MTQTATLWRRRLLIPASLVLALPVGCMQRAVPVVSDTATRAPAQPPVPSRTTAVTGEAPDSAWWSATPTPPRYPGVARQSRYIAMRDGVRLAIDVYLPRGLETAKRLPTIIEQTRYLRSLEPRPELRDSIDRPPGRVTAFVTRGYAYVIVDVRGTGASFGSRDVELGPVEARDGKDVVDWIIGQAWSDGKVGATGVSYVGTTADLLLVNGHPAVKAIAPQFSLFDTYADIAVPGGIPHTWFTTTWARAVAPMDRNQLSEGARRFFVGIRPADGDSGAVWLARAVQEHAANPDVHENLRRIVFRDDTALAGWTFDDISPHAQLDAIRGSGAAIYSYSGWCDGAYPRSAALRFRAIRTPGSRLVLGPWNHGGGSYCGPSGDVRASSFRHTQELLRFFDHHLKGIDTGIGGEPAVRYYTMGEERWKSAAEWPVPGIAKQPWYFSDDHGLSTSAPRASTSADTYLVDTTTRTGARARWNTLVGGGPVVYPDRRSEDTKLLTYTSTPLTRDMEVTGHPIVTLFVSSTAADGNFFVYLEEVDETGRVRYVTEGTLRAIHRKRANPPPYASFLPFHSYRRADALPLVPGEIAELTFDLLPTSYLFRNGSRIRVAIAGADADHFPVLPPTPPTLQMHRTRAYSSRIELPVIPR